MGIRTPNSKVITGDTVKIASAGFQVPLWAVGMEGTVERIGREGGVIVNLGYRAKRKFITAKREQVILVRGINFTPGGKVYDEQGNYRRERRKVKRNANT